MEAVQPRAPKYACAVFSPEFHQSADKVNQRPHTLPKLVEQSRPVIHRRLMLLMIVHTRHGPSTLLCQIPCRLAGRLPGRESWQSADSGHELVIQFFQIKIPLLTTAVQMQPFSNRHVAMGSLLPRFSFTRLNLAPPNPAHVPGAKKKERS